MSSETKEERAGRLTAEIVLENLILQTEDEITHLYKFMFKDIRDIEEAKLKNKLIEAKAALKWTRSRS